MVTLNSFWSGEFVFGVRELYAFDQPFGRSLLGDGSTQVLSTIGDEELGSALLPDLTSPPQVLVQSASDAVCEAPCLFGTEIGTKIGRVVFTLMGILARKLSLVNSVTPALENLRCKKVRKSGCASRTLYEWR